jgi:4-alpha-glucanotransferase
MNPAGQRRAGLLLPLSACATSTSWGIGDIGDVARASHWIAGAGMSVLQLLPLNAMADGQHSPYSAISAMAIDPIFIRVPDVPEFAAIGGLSALSAEQGTELARLQASARVDYEGVRRLKEDALARAFVRFLEAGWRKNTARAQSFQRFLHTEGWWVDDYALFRALHERESRRPWTEWPENLRRRDPQALSTAASELERDVLWHQYLQWVAAVQWRDARSATAAEGIRLFGDLPFMVDGESADVWAHQEEFMLDASVGVPPDAFSATGQDWGMPVYRWDVIAALYDGYRVDHVVGFYRTYARPNDGAEPFFTPAREDDQMATGQCTLAILLEAGAEIIAEDLGIVPDFVRASLARLGIPGFRIFRWERQWDLPGQPFRDPVGYPALSVAASGTHDTEPMRVWWEQAQVDEREQVSVLPTIQRLTGGRGLHQMPDETTVRDVLLEALYASGSNLLLVPAPDVFGWSTRINQPATISDDNWTFRLPWLLDRMDDVTEASACQAKLRVWGNQYGRTISQPPPRP